MIDFRNPYTPGAGVTPKYLAGREDVLEDAQMRIEASSTGYQSRSVVYYGLRGVGKTVLLNEIESMVDNRNLLNCHIEVKEASNFVKAISIACNGFAQSLSMREAVKSKCGKLVSAIKSFTTTWNPEDQTVSFQLEQQSQEPVMSGTGDLANDFTELLVMLGRYSKDADTAICFFVDEIQYATNEELEALITAVHRLNQLGLPIMFFCAGLPKILKTMGDTKSYTERLFEFVEIGSLSSDAAREAIVIPASNLDVDFTEEAIIRIIEITKGYPYFIQEMCNTIWSNHTSKEITLEVVEHNINSTNEKLDAGFFQVRYRRCTTKEQDFMAAMVKCGDLPCVIAQVAKYMQTNVKSISPFRAQLIKKGLIYSTNHGAIDFTVPQFDLFIRRVHADF